MKPKTTNPTVERAYDDLDEVKYKNGFLVRDFNGGVRRLRRAVKLASMSPQEIENQLWEVIHFHPDCAHFGHQRSTRLARFIQKALGLA